MPERVTTNSPLDRLLKLPYRFDFFQAVRLLAWNAHQSREHPTSSSSSGQPIGYDFAPTQEIVRFRAHPGQCFPAAAIHSASLGVRNDNAPRDSASVETANYQLTVEFMGLYGPSGVLPQHYTQLIIDRLRRKDSALRDFCDLLIIA
jgi:type VI secretion system protein ImpH